MNIRSILSILPLIILISCQKQERFVWSELTWKDNSHSTVFIENISTSDKTINISYFNKTTREALDSTINIAPSSKNNIKLELFRPELIDISYGGINKTTYLLPMMNLELTLSDSIETKGEHSKVYSALLEVGDNSKTTLELEAFLKNSKTPNWLTSFLLKSREYKDSYKIYQKAGYQIYIGNTDVNVEPQDSIKAEMLLANPSTGIHYNYHSLLQINKYNYQLRKQNENFENEFFELRQNLINKLQLIENEQIRHNMIAMYTEGIMLRKRKEFKDKDVLYARIISLLPEDYVNKLNKIEKEYISDDYDKSAIIGLLSKKVNSTTGMLSPLNESLKDYKLLKFWFAGCAPCKKQIPYENELLDKYENLSILHFCKSTKETDWRKYISNNNTKGIHYYLTPEMTNEYKSVFNLSYSPRYVLLDKFNNVVCWNCASPSNRKLEELLVSN